MNACCLNLTQMQPATGMHLTDTYRRCMLPTSEALQDQYGAGVRNSLLAQE